jgi:3-oxoacyl-(acyl-carrier-protein) synthase
MLASVNAMDEAGLTAGGGDPERFGVFLGVNVLAWDLTGMTEYLIAAEAPGDAGTLEMRRANQYCMHQINPLDFSLKTLPNLAAGHIAIGQNAQGMCRALTEGAVGGAHAIGQAYRAIVDGDIDLALAGGADYQLEELIFAVHGGLGLFADDDAGGPGPAAGEGAALLVLEDAARAHGRSATVHAEVLGFAAVGGDGVFAPDAEPDPLARRLAGAITAVVEEAGAMPDVVFAHGDGLPAHETAEERALARALGEPAARIPVVRARDRYGDVGAASAAVELAAASVLLDGAAPPPAGTAGPVRRVLVISLGQFGECVVVMVGAPKERL